MSDHFIYQLKLSSSVIGILNTSVLPQGTDGGQVVQKDFGLHHPFGHQGRASVEGHHCLPMNLILRVSPRDVQLLTGIHQHPDT